MVLHLISDDKFTDFAIQQFENVNKGKNLFLIDENHKKSILKYVKKGQLTNLKVVKRGAKSTEQYIRSILPDLSSIIVHNLNYYRAHLINLFGSNIKVCWVFYGSDVYESFKEFNDLKYLPETASIGNFLDIKIKLRNFLRPIFFSLKYRRYGWNFSKRRALKKIDVFANANKKGFEEISKRLNFEAEWIWHSYYDIDDMVKLESDQRKIAGKNILIGNSATPSNNHLDTLSMLSKVDQNSYSKIIIPLNYGNDYYKGIIMKKSKALFHNKVDCMDSFLPLPEYVKILQTCKFQVMNHLRPQATGNIIMGISMGAIIFLNERNPLYEYFTSLGIKIFSIQSDLLSIPVIELSDSEKKNNYNILKKVYSQAEILKGAKAML